MFAPAKESTRHIRDSLCGRTKVLKVLGSWTLGACSSAMHIFSHLVEDAVYDLEGQCALAVVCEVRLVYEEIVVGVQLPEFAVDDVEVLVREEPEHLQAHHTTPHPDQTPYNNNNNNKPRLVVTTTTNHRHVGLCKEGL